MRFRQAFVRRSRTCDLVQAGGERRIGEVGRR
jgi:hypothetical protein